MKSEELINNANQKIDDDLKKQFEADVYNHLANIMSYEEQIKNLETKMVMEQDKIDVLQNQWDEAEYYLRSVNSEYNMTFTTASTNGGY